MSRFNLLFIFGIFLAAAGTAWVQGAPKPKPAPKPADPPVTANLNELSLRVAALETINDFDLSLDQLKYLRGASMNAAQTRTRTPAKATPKLASTLSDLYQALLKQDGAHIPALKDQVDELEDDDNIDLDDDVRATDAGRAKAPELLKHLKASQIAAYLAEHADEVADPVEQMMDALLEIREADAEDVDGEIEDTADEVGRLVAGLDADKAKQISEHVTAWLKAGKPLKDDEFATRHAALLESAERIAGEVPPMLVLTHWMENELAELLSNPQLPTVIEAVIEARTTVKP